LIRKIDDLARINNWNTAYANVASALKGFTQDWLFTTAKMLDWSADQLTWMNLKPRFQKLFATQTDDKLISLILLWASTKQQEHIWQESLTH
jgi:hypothetical protein